MTFTTNLPLVDFKFLADHCFTYLELNKLEFHLEEVLQEPTETEINDLFWLEEEFLCELIGIDYENDYLER